MRVEDGGTSWSSRMFGLFGVDDRADVSHLRWWSSFVHPDDREAIAAALRDAEAGRTAALPFRVERPDGSTRAMVGAAVLEPATPGTSASLVGCVHDVTDHVELDEELRATEARLRRTIEGMDAIAVYREHGEVPLWFSDQLERILGYAPDDFDRFDQWNAIVHPGDLPACRAVWDAEPATWVLEYRVRRADGSWAWIQDRGRRTSPSGGSTSGVFSILTDVTERHELEERRRRLDRLEVAGDLAAGLAHHFNNLLTSVVGYVQLVREATPPGDLQRDLDTALEAANRAAQLTRQMLAFGRREMLVPELLDPGEAIERFVPALRAWLPPAVTIATSRGPGEGRVRIERRLLEQILTHLAVNAAEAMPSGGRLSLATSIVAREAAVLADGLDLQPGSYARIEVVDNGIGMDAATASRVFDPFFTTKGPATGIGLNLSATYGVVRQLGGMIEVETQPGVGTTFIIDLPVVDGH
jgi:PAS domain S-box-containing protein